MFPSHDRGGVSIEWLEKQPLPKLFRLNEEAEKINKAINKEK